MDAIDQALEFIVRREREARARFSRTQVVPPAERDGAGPVQRMDYGAGLEAFRLVGELIRDDPAEFWRTKSLKLTVTDAVGLSLFVWICKPPTQLQSAHRRRRAVGRSPSINYDAPLQEDPKLRLLALGRSSAKRCKRRRQSKPQNWGFANKFNVQKKWRARNDSNVRPSDS